ALRDPSSLLSDNNHKWYQLFIYRPLRPGAAHEGGDLAIKPAKLVWPAWLVAAVTLPAIIFIAFNWHWNFDSEKMGLPLALIFSVLALFFGSLVVLAIGIPHEQGISKWIPRFFRSRIMRFFGKYSYGIYVIHPFVEKHVIWFFNHKHLGFLIGHFVIQLLSPLTSLGISTGLAVLSWHFYEKRFLDLKRYFPSIVGSSSK
ncbi:MAG: acyltransferase family protein, partial [Phycisphaerae bacterium]